MRTCHKSSLFYIPLVHNFSMAAMAIVSKSLFLFLLLLVILITLTTAQPPFVKYYCTDKNGNYSANSTYQNNLNTLLSNINSNTDIDYGFYNFSNGQNSDKVNIIAMCRGDVNTQACHSCLNNSIVLLTRQCPNQKEAIGWYDKCMLRYSNISIFGTMENSPLYYIRNNQNATNADGYNNVVAELLRSLASRAAAGDSRRKFSEANKTGPSFQTIFAHVQCTPDLSELDCNRCLFDTISYIPTCCAGKIRARLFRPSCNLRFDTTPYFDLITDVTSVSPPAFHSPPSSTAAAFRKGSHHDMFHASYLTISY